MDNVSRYSAAFILFAVGDALGWPNEYRSNNVKVKNEYILFEDWTRYSGGRYWRCEEKIKGGEYSDDTQLMIATARSILYNKDWARNFSNVELPFWLKYERGGGKSTKNAAKIFCNSKKPWNLNGKELKDYFNSGGNGVAMRILPHVIAEKHNLKQLMGKVIINGIYTHGHPRALLGATCYAYALDSLSQKEEKLEYGELVNKLLENKNIWTHFPELDGIEEWKRKFEFVFNKEFDIVWKENVELVIKELENISKHMANGILDITNTTLEELGVFDKKVNGAGDITAITAIYLASKYATNPKKAIETAANLKGADTDTIAAMTGALLGILYGEEIIPLEWKNVQDYQYLKKLPEYILKPELYFEENVVDEGYIKSPIGFLKKIEEKEYIISNSRKVIIKKYISYHGQTLYIKERIKTANEVSTQENNTFIIEIMQSNEFKNWKTRDIIQCLYDIMNGEDENKIKKEYKINDMLISKIKKYL